MLFHSLTQTTYIKVNKQLIHQFAPDFADDPRLPPFFFSSSCATHKIMSQNNCQAIESVSYSSRLTRCDCSCISLFLIWDELNAASRIQSEGGSRLRHIKSSANRTNTQSVPLEPTEICGPSGNSICPDAPMIGGNERLTILCMKIAFLFFIPLLFMIGNNRPRQVC